MERIGENAILMLFHAIVPDIRSSEEPENILTTNYRGFSSSVLNFLLVRVKDLLS